MSKKKEELKHVYINGKRFIDATNLMIADAPKTELTSEMITAIDNDPAEDIVEKYLEEEGTKQSKLLGKITKAEFGIYENSLLGLILEFSFDGKGAMFTKDTVWDYTHVKHVKRCVWTDEERDSDSVLIMRTVSSILSDAKKKSVHDLVGTPVEVIIKDNTIQNYRILTEVL